MSTQSPIDLSGDTVSCSNNCSLIFSYTTSKLIPVLTNPNSQNKKDLFFEWNADPSSSITFKGSIYYLKSISFIMSGGNDRTSTGGHSIDGQKSLLEINLCHQNPINNNWTIIAIPAYQNDSPSRPNNFLSQTTDKLPSNPNVSIQPRISFTMKDDWNPFDLIPDVKSFYHYVGSFYREPTGSDVNWIVFDNEITIGSTFIDKLSQILGPNNGRQIQERGNRTLYYSRNLEPAANFNYNTGIKCYTPAQFKQACSCAVDNTDILTVRNRFYMIATASVSVIVIVILLVLWYYSRK
jgi:carbonic anhydrase